MSEGLSPAKIDLSKKQNDNLLIQFSKKGEAIGRLIFAEQHETKLT